MLEKVSPCENSGENGILLSDISGKHFMAILWCLIASFANAKGFFYWSSTKSRGGGKLKRLRFFCYTLPLLQLYFFSIEEDLTKDKEQSPMTITKESSLQPQKKFCHIFVPIVMLLMIKYD